MISLSDRAAKEIRDAQAEKNIIGYGLRIQVVGGGCEGFLYDLLFSHAPDAKDRVFSSQGIELFVDSKSVAFLDGLIIDYAPTPYGEGFVFRNPHARGQCACGASFSP